MVSAKGYLFTISIIFIASTLIFFAQSYSAKNLSEQNAIIYSYKTGLEPYLLDDLTQDILQLTGLRASTTFSNNLLKVQLSDSLKRDARFNEEFIRYKSFVDLNYFTKVQGQKVLDLNGLTDGSYEAFIGNSLVYVNKYDSNKLALLANENSVLSLIDLNVFIEGDINSISWNPTNSGVVVPITIRVFSDSNNFTQIGTIDPSLISTFEIDHSIDPSDKTIITLGGVFDKTDSIEIDSNAVDTITFSLLAEYSGPTESQPIDMNALFSYSTETIQTNSLLRLYR